MPGISGTPQPHPESIIVIAISRNKPGLIIFIDYFVENEINYLAIGD